MQYKTYLQFCLLLTYPLKIISALSTVENSQEAMSRALEHVVPIVKLTLESKAAGEELFSGRRFPN